MIKTLKLLKLYVAKETVFIGLSLLLSLLIDMKKFFFLGVVVDYYLNKIAVSLAG